MDCFSSPMWWFEGVSSCEREKAGLRRGASYNLQVNGILFELERVTDKGRFNVLN